MAKKKELTGGLTEEMAMIAFKLPPKLKKALALVAADMGEGVTVSSLLRSAVVDMVSSHRDGYFFKLDALSKEQNTPDPKVISQPQILELPQAG